MPATEEQYDHRSKHPGFHSEGQRIDYLEALHEEYATLAARGADRADLVAEELVKMGESDPRPKRSRAAVQTRGE